jgi:hypothetical protein
VLNKCTKLIMFIVNIQKNITNICFLQPFSWVSTWDRLTETSHHLFFVGNHVSHTKQVVGQNKWWDKLQRNNMFLCLDVDAVGVSFSKVSLSFMILYMINNILFIYICDYKLFLMKHNRQNLCASYISSIPLIIRGV